MPYRSTLAVLMLALAIIFALPARAQQKPFTQAQVSDMVRDGLGNVSGAKLIERRGVDFLPAEDFLQSLKAAGANETFLRALRAANSPIAGGGKRPLNQAQVLGLLAAQTNSHRVAKMVEKRGLDFNPTEEYLQEVHSAGGDDELASALKNAKVIKPKSVDPGLQARETEVRQHASRGAELLREKHYADAQTEYRAAVQLDPQDSDLHLSLAWALAGNDNLDQATEECREALRLNPDNDIAHLFLGHALGNAGDADGEISEYREALRLNPSNVLAHLDLGLALGRKQDWEGAIVQYREALRLNWQDESAPPSFRAASGRKDDGEGVIAVSRQALSQSPTHENTHLNLGLALGMDGDWDAAAAEEREVVGADPNNALAHYLLGIALDAKSDRQGALQQYRTAHGLDPKNQTYRQAYERLQQSQ